MIWKWACKHQTTWEIHSMRDLKVVVERWCQQHTGTAWGELDIEETFPNIARDEVQPAISFFFKKWRVTS